MPLLQDVIHKIEVAGGVRYIRYSLTLLVAALLIVLYNVRVARNMATQEAMDTAQLGRSIAAGKGYTTQFVRPFSMYLIGSRNQEKFGSIPTNDIPDYSQIRRAHPDVSNPPAYPVFSPA